MSRPNGGAPDLGKVPALRGLIAELEAARRGRDARTAERADIDRKIPAVESALFRTGADQAALDRLLEGEPAVDVVLSVDPEEARRSLATLRRSHRLLLIAAPQDEKIVAAAETALTEAARVTPEVIDPFLALERDVVLTAIALDTKYAAVVAYEDGMRAQDVTLPTLGFLPAIGSLRRPTEGGLVPQLVLAGLELGLISGNDVPDTADPYVRVKGRELRAERERPVPPPPAPRKPPEAKRSFVPTFSHLGKIRGKL